jgi:hypothetical protein
MEVDDEIGRRLWPGFGGQPQAAPQPAAPEQPPEALQPSRKRLTIRRSAPDGAGGVRRQAGGTPAR